MIEFKFNKDNLLRTIDHLFLPYRIYKSPGEDYQQHEATFLIILNEALESISKIDQINFHDEKFAEIKELFRRWYEVQKNQFLDGETITKSIKDLKRNQAAAYYLREQNASLIIKLEHTGEYVASLFQPSATNNQIMSNESDIFGVFPKFTFKIKHVNMLLSNCFGLQLADLANKPSSHATTRKSHSTHIEIRDLPEPKLVYEWLPTVLIDNSDSVFVENTQKIVKKIRDDIVHFNKRLPFRRSGLWMSIKLVLQLRLYEIYGEIEGKYLYKIIITLALNRICKETLEHEIKSDLKLEMIKKLARRLYKLDILHKDLVQKINQGDVKPLILFSKTLDLDNFNGYIFGLCGDTIQTIRNNLDQLFKKVTAASRSLPAKLDFKKIDLNDKIHKNLHDFIEKINNKENSDMNSRTVGNISVPKCSPRNLNNDFPNISYLDSNDCLLTALYDIETWIQNLDLDAVSKNETLNSLEILKLMEKYIEKATNFYENDELGNSRMILTCIKIVCVLDKIACNAYPLLLEHKIGFNKEPFEYLLLPRSTEISYLHILKSYMDKRNGNSRFNSLVDCENVDGNMFGVRYAKSNPEMICLRERIQQESKDRKNKKIIELIEQREIYNDLIKEANREKCTCYRYSWSCTKCSLLSQAKNMVLSIHEESLPENIDKQYAVIFELKIPEKICYLRDALHLLKTKIFGFKNYYEDKKPNYFKTWLNANHIEQYSSGRQRHVTLGSSAKSFTDAHYRGYHPTTNDSEFFKPHGFKVEYCDLKTIFEYTPTNKLEELSTFKVAKPYDILDWTLKATTHTENQVLALQSKCPLDMTLHEFNKFGAFRAGHRLQLLNLIGAIEQRVLSFDQESVFSLIAQSIWQIGPLDTTGDQISSFEPNFFYPASHSWFSNPQYYSLLYDITFDFLKISSKCWSDHLKLINIIIISARGVSLAPNKECRNLMINLLLKCREIAEDWVKTINNISDENTRLSLKGKLLEICCFHILTYYVDKKYLDLVIRDDRDIITWQKMMCLIYDHKILFQVSEKTHVFRTNIYRRTIVSLLNLESHICNMINNNKNVLTEFLNQHWSDSQEGKVVEWNQYVQPAQQWFYAKFKRNKDNTDILLQLGVQGEFLVNSRPVGKLPKDVYNHQYFKDFFEATDFDVQPSSNSIEYVTTTKEINNKFHVYYSFLSSHELIIKEKRCSKGENDVRVYQFLPSKLFENLFPNNLIDCFSHWLHIGSELIEFRSKKYANSDYYHKTYYRLDLNELTLYDVENERYVIDIQSETFSEIHTKILWRLELSGFVHIFENSGRLLIQLPRMGLKFELDFKQESVLPLDFPGMIVSDSQKLDTLFGLEQGLLIIENKNVEKIFKEKLKKQLIIPNGEIENHVNNEMCEHHSTKVNIEVGKIKEPGYYSYEIDVYLKKLKAEQSTNAWLYLTLLHGSTSYILPDPFLGCTGTEMALGILQSAICWSAQPLDKQTIDILQEISNLSPVRQFYPPHLKNMQMIKWPPCIPSYAAHECFRWISNKIISDSERIPFAFSSKVNNATDKLVDKKINFYLSRRAYNRYQVYYTESALLNSNFESIMSVPANPVLLFNDKDDFSTTQINNARLISTENYLSRNNSFDLESFLFQYENLNGSSQQGFDVEVLSEWEEIVPDIRNKWIDLYNYSRDRTKTEHYEKRILLFSFLAYNNISMNLIYFLQKVLNNAELFQSIDPPSYSPFQTGYGYVYKSETIKSILKDNFISLNDFQNQHNRRSYEEYYEFEKRIKSEYDVKKRKETTENEAVVQKYWYQNYSILSLTHLNYQITSSALNGINFAFKNWRENIELIQFIRALVEKIENLPKLDPIALTDIKCSNVNNCNSMHQKTEYEFHFIIEKKLSKNEYSNFKRIYESGRTENLVALDGLEFPFKNGNNTKKVKKVFLDGLEESWKYYHSTMQNQFTNDNQKLKKYCELSFENYFDCATRLWKLILDLTKDDSLLTEIFASADLRPRITPSNILKWIISDSDSNLKIDVEIKDLFGAVAVLWSLEQRMLRCIAYIDEGKSKESILNKELFENQPHENWSPREFPQWLIFELEQNIMIRKIQVQIAQTMMNPPDGKNIVLQLNMGEGKTSVIIPLLVTALADSSNIPRVVVLKQLFSMNYSALVQKLGCVLNKRVYVLPCQRDIAFSEERVIQYQNIYNECKSNKGVIITLPEYILSFKLKGLEISRLATQKKQLAQALLDMQNCIENSVRDILDESDELLSHLYQLIYPVGNNSIVDGNELRWLVAQDVLNLARNHFKSLKDTFGDTALEYHENSDYPQAFPTFRFLNETAYCELCKRVCHDLLSGKFSNAKFLELRQDQKQHVKKYILELKIDQESREYVHELFPEKSYSRTILVILRGYLAYKVLYTVLTKRWRVEYGVNFNRNDLLQAVPYRAKDVPAERAQYAHPDIAILLTQLSYYHTGLSEKQLDDVFLNLRKCLDSSDEYKSWIKSLPDACIIHDSVKEYSGINLDDSDQKLNKLYPLLKYHTKVIDYWLCEFLYPKEAKQFSAKYRTSAWDLCPIRPKPVTGFSGTNDSRLLLPTSIEFKEITELKGTNGMLLSHLLLPENKEIEFLPADCSGEQILRIICSSSSALHLVLLDVGALMLEFNNEMVIKKWMELKTNIEAGIYFDENDKLVVIDRKNNKTLFDISPYKNKLDKCVVYLDQCHTRGTDLKFPYGTTGAVTLGKGVTKDKLMQGCMRLRMLGNGHSVKFYAAFEVYKSIKKDTNKIKTQDLLSWVIDNSERETTNGFLYWADQGSSYYRREAVFSNFKTNNCILDYANNSKEHEITELLKLYNGDRLQTSVSDLILNRSQLIEKDLNSISSSLSKAFEENLVSIHDKLIEFVSDEKIYAHFFDEEQELELEVEQEEEREQERPPTAEALKNSFDENVKKLFTQGVFKVESDSFLKLPYALNNSSLKSKIEHQAWSDALYVTRDFRSTVKGLDEKDSYLRPPRWLCIHGQNENMKMIFLSDFEANEMIPLSDPSKSMIITFLPRLRQDQKRLLKLNGVIKADHFDYLIEQIAIFSGSLYLNTIKEQTAFLAFVGYCPGPRTEIEQQYFEDQLIQQNGYVPEAKREKIFKASPYEISKFVSDPQEVILKLYSIRNYNFIPKTSHHLQLLNFGKKIFF